MAIRLPTEPKGSAETAARIYGGLEKSWMCGYDPAEDGRRLGKRLAADFRRKVEEITVGESVAEANVLNLPTEPEGYAETVTRIYGGLAKSWNCGYDAAVETVRCLANGIGDEEIKSTLAVAVDFLEKVRPQ